MDIVTTVEELKGIVSKDCKVTENTFTGFNLADYRKVTVEGGSVNLKDAVIEGMTINFNKCTIYGRTQKDDFRNCNVSIRNCIVQSIHFVNTIICIKDSEAILLTIDGGSLNISKGTKIEHCIINHTNIWAEPEKIVEIHKGKNSISPWATIELSTATCSNFGTYNGNVHYFKKLDTVIAGCWIGKLEEFLERAEQRGIPKEKRESVYNYFKSFK